MHLPSSFSCPPSRAPVTSNRDLRSDLRVHSGPPRSDNPLVGCPSVRRKQFEHDASKSTGRAHGPDRTRQGVRKFLSDPCSTVQIFRHRLLPGLLFPLELIQARYIPNFIALFHTEFVQGLYKPAPEAPRPARPHPSSTSALICDINPLLWLPTATSI